jgi:hypothetical protein
MGVVSFSGGWYPYAPVTTPDFAKAGRGATRSRSFGFMQTTTASTTKR